MELTFDGFTMTEFMDYLRKNNTYQFDDLYECSLLEDDEDPNIAEISWWPIYDHNSIIVETVSDFFDNMNT